MTGVAIVTGASRGLGQAFSVELRSRGFAVAGCSANAPANADVAQVDVADAAGLERFAADVAARLGPIDLWVNGAGVLGPIGPTRTSDSAQWARAVDVNLLGTVNGTRAFLAHHAPGALLVNLASRVGLRPAAGLAAYSTTKAAVIALTHAIAAEEEQAGVRAVVVIPPSVDTDMQRELLKQVPDVFPGVIESRARRDRGEIRSPQEAAALIAHALLDQPLAGVVIDLTGVARGR